MPYFSATLLSENPRLLVAKQQITQNRHLGVFRLRQLLPPSLGGTDQLQNAVFSWYFLREVSEKGVLSSIESLFEKSWAQKADWSLERSRAAFCEVGVSSRRPSGRCRTCL